MFVDVVGKINAQSDDCDLFSARVADHGAQFFCANLATKQRGRTMLKSIIAAALTAHSVLPSQRRHGPGARPIAHTTVSGRSMASRFAAAVGRVRAHRSHNARWLIGNVRFEER